MSVQNLMDQAEIRTKGKEVFTVIDANGEIRDDVKVITPLMQEKADKKREIETYSNKAENHFIFTEKDGVKFDELFQLTNKQLGYFLVLQTYIDYHNMLRIKDAKLPMKNVEIRKALRIKTNSTFKKLMREFEELGLIHYAEVELFGKSYVGVFINDKYCFKKGLYGDNKNRKINTTVKVFIDTLQDIYSQDKVSASDVGLIYKAMEFVHYDTNVLAQNPSERDEALVHPLNMDEFADAVGISRQKIHVKLSSLNYPCKYKGQELELKVFARVKVGKQTFLKLNPFVAWRKQGYPPVEEYGVFIFEYNMRNKKL
ncbi:hypothetical protein ABEY65_27595 [Priestia aryabhattai]|uniref:hypothetical protein n=1 Tax=Priestia aryabhattai TaxID=412384 RepID=UPI003D280B93